MRHILFLLFAMLTVQAIAQYPATGNKMRLGWQTTGDGLVYRGAIGDTATLDPSGLNNAWMLLDTANGNLYAYRAKAWRLVSGGGGSVSDTLTGEVKGPLDSTYIDTVANIIFTTTTDTTVGVGELEYNDTQGSLIQGLKGGNVTNVIGQQIHQRVTNITGGTLTKGTAVFLHSSQGNRITVRKALATVDSTSANTFGIVAESIADNQSGYVITEGLITNMNTNALTEGAAVYLSPTVAGELTTTKPQAPQHTVYIGVCVKQNAGSGELFVKIRNGQELDELHDVRISSPDSSASLYYNASESVWRDTTAAVLTSDTSVFARDFQISGTTNRLAMFTGGNRVGNSIVTQNGRNLYINSTQDNSASSLSNSFQFNGFGSNAFDQPSIGVFGNTGTNPNHRPYLAMYRSFGDTANSRTLVPFNSYLGSIVWHGADGVNLASRGAEIGAITDSITGITDMPTALFFGTTTNGAASPTERMRITSPGNVGINTTTPAHRLDVNGDVNTTGMYKKSGTDIISGTTNYIPKFTGANTIGNSAIYEINKKILVNSTSSITTFNLPTIELHGNGSDLTTDQPIIAVSANNGKNSAISRGYLNLNRSGGTTAGNTTLVPYDYFIGTLRWAATDGIQPLSGAEISAITDSITGNFDMPTALTFATTANGAASPTERMRITSAGNVGIGTASPDRILHVNATSAIRIPVGTTGQRPSPGADGDIRYNTTNANFEWYSGSGWREPVNAARSPAAGLANRFSKFDANGLLDTSAILIQANNRIGIGNAAPDSTLTVTGGGNFSGGVRALNYTLPTTGNRPALGMYSRVTNRLSFAVNDTLRFEILPKGTANLTATTESPTAPAFALTVNGGGIQAKNYLTLNGDSLANSAPQITVLNQDVATSGGYVVFQKRRGGGGSGSVNSGAVVDGDELGTFAWGGKIKSVGGIYVSAGFRANVAGTVTDTFAPVDFTIFTSPRSDGTAFRVPVKTDRLTIKPSGNVGIGTASPTALLHINGSLSRNAPVTVTASTHTVDSLTNWVICNRSAGTITLTLPAASSWTGREIMIKTIEAQTVVSASSNVVPLAGGAATTAILPATDGAWCTLVSDGTNWIIMQRGS